MSTYNLLYRLRQKWKYHTASTSFEKKVAEINRNGPVIAQKDGFFWLIGSSVKLDSSYHEFVLDRFDSFTTLINSEGEFSFEGTEVFFTIRNIKLLVTTAEELFIINEIYIENCYSIAVLGAYQVIDVGMNVGYASLFFANDPKVEMVYGYEPFTTTFEHAQKNIVSNPHLQKKIKPFNVGLGKKDEVIEVSFSQNLKGKNSIQPAQFPNEKITLKEASNLISVICENNPSLPLFIKMDCEGSEFDIFSQLSQSPIATQIFGFIIEYHFRNPQPIISTLNENNFKCQVRGNSEIGLITAFR